MVFAGAGLELQSAVGSNSIDSPEFWDSLGALGSRGSGTATEHVSLVHRVGFSKHLSLALGLSTVSQVYDRSRSIHFEKRVERSR